MSDQGPPPPTPHPRGAKKTIVRREGDWDCMVSQLRNIKNRHIIVYTIEQLQPTSMVTHVPEHDLEHEIYGDEIHLCCFCVCAMKILLLVSSHCILMLSSFPYDPNLSLVLARPAAISAMPIVAVVAPAVLRSQP